MVFTVQIIYNTGIDVNSPNKYGMSPLHYVTTPQLVSFFIDRGANDVASDRLKRTPIVSAKEGNLMDVFRVYTSMNDTRTRQRTKRLDTAKSKREMALKKIEQNHQKEHEHWMRTREAKFKAKMKHVSTASFTSHRKVP